MGELNVSLEKGDLDPSLSPPTPQPAGLQMDLTWLIFHFANTVPKDHEHHRVTVCGGKKIRINESIGGC